MPASPIYIFQTGISIFMDGPVKCEIELLTKHSVILRKNKYEAG